MQLWQSVFEETFAQYHRLSSMLASKEDASTAEGLWTDYLGHVQSFLDESAPTASPDAGSYSWLCEQQRVCCVHSSLLGNHRGLISTCGADALVDKHDRTMARLAARSADLARRLSDWDALRDAQTKLAEWIRRTEKHKLAMNLRHVSLDSVPDLMNKIEVSQFN